MGRRGVGLIVLGCLTALPALAKSPCDVASPSGPLFPAVKGLKEGGKTLCDVGGEASSCMKIDYQGKTLYCMVNYVRTKLGAFGVPCELGAHDDGGYDKLYDTYSRVVWDAKKKTVRFAKIPAPGLTAFSSPKFCADRIAYWSIEKVGGENEVKAAVYDLTLKSVIKEEKVGTSPTGDYFHTFPPPKWSESGNAVQFQPPARGGGKLSGTTLELK